MVQSGQRAATREREEEEQGEREGTRRVARGAAAAAFGIGQRHVGIDGVGRLAAREATGDTNRREAFGRVPAFAPRGAEEHDREAAAFGAPTPQALVVARTQIRATVRVFPVPGPPEMTAS